MVYLLANSPISATAAQLVQTDMRSAMSDRRFQNRSDEAAIVRQENAERLKASIDISKWTGPDKTDRKKLDELAKSYDLDRLDVVVALAQLDAEYEKKLQNSTSSGSWGSKLDFPSPAHAAQWGQEAMADLKSLMSIHNMNIQLYNGRKESMEAMRSSAQDFYKAQGYSDDAARDAAAQTAAHYEKSLLEGVTRTRSLINMTILRLSDQFDVSGALVKLNDDGTLSQGDAAASWGGALTLLSGDAKAPADAAGKVEALDGKVREQTDLWSHSLEPIRPADVPPAGGFVNRVA
jgi:hypothetical protein